MPKLFVLRVLLGLIVVASLGIASATPALASGTANWQVTFSGTTAPGFGFSGSCTSTMFPAFPRVPVR